MDESIHWEGDLAPSTDAIASDEEVLAASTGARILDLPRVANVPALIGASLDNARATLARVASADCPVLLTGETGTGKELAARRVHALSGRRDRPWIAVGCPALSGDLFRQEMFGVPGSEATGPGDGVGLAQAADGGTLFLDEVAALDPAAQACLLRFVETGLPPVSGAVRSRWLDVRIIASTRRDLAAEVAWGRFRMDLYYRLAGVRVQLPPLRERGEDLTELIDHFLATAIRAGEDVRLTAAARAVLISHHWPGNVRELRHALEGARITSGGVIERDDLPAEIRRPTVEGTESPARPAPEHLFAEILQSTGCFWRLVYEPYRNRELDRSDLVAVVQRAYRAAGRSYKAVATMFGLPEQDHRRLADFLRNQGLGIRSREVTAAGAG